MRNNRLDSALTAFKSLEPLNKGASAETEGTVQFFSFQQKQQTPWSGWGEAGKRPQAHSFFASTRQSPGRSAEGQPASSCSDALQGGRQALMAAASIKGVANRSAASPAGVN